MIKTYDIAEIDKVAIQLWELGRPYKHWAFYAPMGAGKTTMIHAVCELLGVKEAISSPTFALINEYASPLAGTIYHMDWYRLKDEEEAIQAGMEDAVLSDHYCFIEWPEKAEGILPPDTFVIQIDPIDENTRKITASPGALAKKN